MPNVAQASRFDARVPEHYRAAQLLHGAGEEWAAVCYFYAAYSAARAAFYLDPRLDSDASARAADPDLSATSRHTQHHNGHKSRGPGINDIVRKLYPAIATEYEALHVWSNAVRYEQGLISVTLGDVKTVADKVIATLNAVGAPR